MTRKIYETECYVSRFPAKVLSCTEEKGRYAVTVDQTAFFPEGGGQYADTGKMGGVNVLDVQEKKGEIIHYTDGPLTVGETVSCVLNWGQRFRRMQNHTGEHIVSGMIHSLYGLNNVGFHLGNEYVTLDLDGKLTPEQIVTVEQWANETVFRNAPVTVSFPSPEELRELDYRSKLDLTENVRIVTIEGADCCACCAPHVRQTGEIGIIRLLDAIPYKGGTRITMLCGWEMLQRSREETETLSDLSRLLSAPPAKTPEAVQKALTESAALRAEVRQLKSKLAFASLRIDEIGTVCLGVTGAGCGYDELRFCCEQLSDRGTVRLLLSPQEGGFLYAVSSGNDLRPFVQSWNKALAGRGGGKGGFAQGAVKAGYEDIVRYLSSLPETEE